VAGGPDAAVIAAGRILDSAYRKTLWRRPVYLQGVLRGRATWLRTLVPARAIYGLAMAVLNGLYTVWCPPSAGVPPPNAKIRV